jgi:hypothetical protein
MPHARSPGLWVELYTTEGKDTDMSGEEAKSYSKATDIGWEATDTRVMARDATSKTTGAKGLHRPHTRPLKLQVKLKRLQIRPRGPGSIQQRPSLRLGRLLVRTWMQPRV